MEAELLKTVGQIAGIGGISLGVFLFLFRDILRKNIFPELSKKQAFRLLTLISILVWTVALAGIGAWLWSNTEFTKTPDKEVVQTVEKNALGIIHTGKGDINVNTEN